MQHAAHDDAPFGEEHFFSYLAVQILTCASAGWRDVLGANIAFRELFFVHGAVDQSLNGFNAAARLERSAENAMFFYLAFLNGSSFANDLTGFWIIN